MVVDLIVSVTVWFFGFGACLIWLLQIGLCLRVNLPWVAWLWVWIGVDFVGLCGFDWFG